MKASRVYRKAAQAIANGDYDFITFLPRLQDYRFSLLFDQDDLKSFFRDRRHRVIALLIMSQIAADEERS